MPFPSPELFPSPDLFPDGANLYDYETSNNQEVVYRIRAAHILSPEAGSPNIKASFSGWTESPTVSWFSDFFWIKHPTLPSFNLTVEMATPADGGISSEARENTFQAIGSTTPVVITDTRAGATGTLKVLCQTQEEKDALQEIIDQEVSVLLQCREQDHFPDRWLSLGTHTSERVVDQAWVEPTWETLTWTTVDPPAGKLLEF